MRPPGLAAGPTAPDAVPRRVLPVTILVVASGTAVYFAGTAAAPALVDEWSIGPSAAAALTWAVQAGFIAGTLTTAALNLPDRVRPDRLVAALLVLSAVANAAFTLLDGNVPAAVALRFLAGALAGPVYPIGMKLLATWYESLGRGLGLLIGFYTAGAGLAFFLRAAQLDWRMSLAGASAFALVGAVVALALLQPGPRLPLSSPLDAGAAARAFRVPEFRRSALAYFGHMWELFAFWATLPFWLASTGLPATSVLALTGGVFLAGGLGCVLAGEWSRRVGEARAARAALATSGLLCLASPWLHEAPLPVLAPLVLVWGAAVIADSGMFSAVSARAAPRAYVGTALTAQNMIGFLITIPSIALLPLLADATGSWRLVFLALAPGPLLALLPVTRLVRDARATSQS